MGLKEIITSHSTCF